MPTWHFIIKATRKGSTEMASNEQTIDIKTPKLFGYQWKIWGEGTKSFGELRDQYGRLCAEFNNKDFSYKIFGNPPEDDISPLMPYDTISLEWLEGMVESRISEYWQENERDEELESLQSRCKDLEDELNDADYKVAQLEARIAKLEAQNTALLDAANNTHDGGDVYKAVCTMKNGETVNDFFEGYPSAESLDKTMKARQQYFKQAKGIEFDYVIVQSDRVEMMQSRCENLMKENAKLKSECAKLEARAGIGYPFEIKYAFFGDSLAPVERNDTIITAPNIEAAISEFYRKHNDGNYSVITCKPVNDTPEKTAPKAADKPRPVRDSLEKAINEAKSNAGKQHNQQKETNRTQETIERS